MFFYLAYWILCPFIWFLILIISLFNFKVRHHLLNEQKSFQFVKNKLRDNDKTVLLMHAASMGEFEQLIPILNEIDRNKFFIILSFFSPTGYEQQKNTSLVDAVCYHPFDLPWSAFFFLKKLKIQHYITTRNDIWPNHLFIAKRMGIKTALINANFYKKSHMNSSFIINVYKQIFKNINIILTGSNRLKENLKLLSPENKIHVTGDSRIDQVFNRKKHNQKKLLPTIFETSNTLILGSIEKTDYEILFSSLAEHYPNGQQNLNEKNDCIIIVPHETHLKNIEEINTQLKKMNFNPIYYSEKEKKESRVIIINTVGILADLYKYSNLAYVGAGFNGGVHSVIEPMAYANAISFGPKFNIVDLAISLVDLELAHVINSKDDFLTFLNIAKNKKLLNEIKINMKQFNQEQQSSSKNIISKLF